MGVIPCPACRGEEELRLSCQFCAQKGYVPDGPGAVTSRGWLTLKITAGVLLALLVISWSFLYPRDPDMDLLREGLNEKEFFVVKDIDLVRGTVGKWVFGTVTTDDGRRFPIAAKWSIDRTRDDWDEMRVAWILGKTPVAVEEIERLKSVK